MKTSLMLLSGCLVLILAVDGEQSARAGGDPIGDFIRSGKLDSKKAKLPPLRRNNFKPAGAESRPNRAGKSDLLPKGRIGAGKTRGEAPAAKGAPGGDFVPVAPGAHKTQPVAHKVPPAGPRPLFAQRGAQRLKLMAGQMVMVGFRGTSAQGKGVRAVLDEIRRGELGGVMIMGHNVRSIAQLQTLSRALRKAACMGRQPVPFIAIDQEGGLVQRLKTTRYPSAKKMASLGPKAAAQYYGKMARELRAAGVNVNFGPVVDVDVQGRKNPIIGRMGRAYSADAAKVTQYAKIFVRAHHKQGILAVAKHFPGHGSSLSDSHKGFTAIPAWSAKRELLPYRKLATGKDAVDMVMVGHLYNKAWGAPASLSYKAVSGILRRQVGFSGVAITDDMEMGAIRKSYGWGQAIRLAVNAGEDILLYSNTARYDPFLARKIRDGILKANPRRIAQAYGRIMRLKARLGDPCR